MLIFTALLSSIALGSVAQQAYLKASNADRLDSFGSSMAISGNTAVVGAPDEGSSATGVNGDESNNDAFGTGAAYVFVRGANGWEQQAYLKASNAEPLDYFGTSVAIHGDTIVVTAYGEDSASETIDGDQSDNNGLNRGAAYVFVRDGSTWTQQAYIKGSVTAPESSFGRCALHEDTLVIGTPTDMGGSIWEGAAYVFERSGSTWSEAARLVAPNAGPGDSFGYSVAVEGDTIVIGAEGEFGGSPGVNGSLTDDSMPYAGAAYVFQRNGSAWVWTDYLKASNPDQGDGFGESVAISGNTIAVGARGERSAASGVNGNQADNSMPSAGAVYVFQRDANSWSQQAYVKASNPGIGDWFGRAIALKQDLMVVGAPYEGSAATGLNGDQLDDSAYWAGAAYAFVRAGTTWQQSHYVKAASTNELDLFGFQVALSGQALVCTAPYEGSRATGVNGDPSLEGAPESGAAYVFDGFCRLGQIYCTPAESNSTGRPATIEPCGSSLVLDNDVQLMFQGLPANRFGYLLVSDTQALVMNPGGSQGNLCLGQPIAGFVGQVQSSGSNGVAALEVDLTNVPFFGAVLPGDTLNFQFWYRDVNPLATSNFSDAVSITFE